MQTAFTAGAGVVRQRAVTQVSSPALTTDAVMLTPCRSTLVRHRSTPGTDARHPLLTPQPLQLHDVAVLQPQVPDAAAVKRRSTSRVQPPRQPVGAARPAHVQRRTDVQRAVVRFQTVAVLLVVQRQPQRAAVPIDPHVMWTIVRHPWSISQSPTNQSIINHNHICIFCADFSDFCYINLSVLLLSFVLCLDFTGSRWCNFRCFTVLPCRQGSICHAVIGR